MHRKLSPIAVDSEPQPPKADDIPKKIAKSIDNILKETQKVEWNTEFERELIDGVLSKYKLPIDKRELGSKIMYFAKCYLYQI